MSEPVVRSRRKDKEGEGEKVDDFVYISVSLLKVKRSKAEEIVKAVVNLAPSHNVSVHYDTPYDETAEGENGDA